MSHHGDDPDAILKQKAFLEQFDETLKQESERMEILGEKLGATNLFPEGKLNDNDEGQLKFAVAIYEGKVVINFNTPTAWIGFDGEQAISLGQLLIKKGEKVLGKGAN